MPEPLPFDGQEKLGTKEINGVLNKKSGVMGFRVFHQIFVK
jgi:hypothetical protein